MIAQDEFQPDIISDSLASAPFNTEYKIENIAYDTSELNIRYVDSAKILIHLKEKDFRYIDNPEYYKTFWERFLDWLNRQYQNLTEYKTYDTIGDILIYILIALAVLAIIFGFYRSEIKGLFLKSEDKDKLKISESAEDIHSIDYDALIEEAIANRNFRYATRLNYLRTLKILSDKKIINWKIDKTNNEFIKEIKPVSVKNKFRSITFNFEFVWYGAVDIDSDTYKSLQKEYSEFNSLLERV